MKKNINRVGMFGDGSYNAINLINFSSKATECLIVLISSDKSWLINLYVSYRKKKMLFGGNLKITRDLFKYNTSKTWQFIGVRALSGSGGVGGGRWKCKWKKLRNVESLHIQWRMVKAEFSSSAILKTSCALPFPNGLIYFLFAASSFLSWLPA